MTNKRKYKTSKELTKLQNFDSTKNWNLLSYKEALHIKAQIHVK